VTPVLIQAGGRGLRLHPLTDHNPKPLLKVGGKPILETIIDGFAAQGFRRIWLSVHYRADLIKGHFGDGSEKGVKIKYLEEKSPQGTGGALRLLPRWDKPFIVSNADVLTKINYGHLMEAHARANVLATVCAGLYQQQIKYGVIDSEDGRLLRVREKPIENFQVNAGIYVLEPDARDFAPEGPFDMTDLIERLPQAGARAGAAVYPLTDYWCDIGGFEDYARANAEWSH